MKFNLRAQYGNFLCTNSVLMLLFVVFCANSQTNEIGLPAIKNYNKSEYGAGTQNWDIGQDTNGSIFFANNKGLLAFNGTNWQLHEMPKKGEVRCLKVDPSGKIYVGGNNEFGYFLPDAKGKLIYTSLSKSLPEWATKDLNLIWRIHLLNDEVVFQSFSTIFIYKAGRLASYKAPQKFQFSFAVQGKLYVQDKKEGILSFEKGKFRKCQGSTFFNDVEIWGMFSLGPDLMLIATLEKGVFVYDFKTVHTWNTEANQFLLSNVSLGGCTLIDGKFVFNTVLSGFIIADSYGKILKHVNRERGLQNNTILSSFQDDHKNIWLGLDNGVSFVNEHSPFNYFDYSLNIGTVYASVYYNNLLYVATNQGLFCQSWSKLEGNESFRRVRGINSQVWNIQVVQGQLLCSSNSGSFIVKDDHVVKAIDNLGCFGFKFLHKYPGFLIGQRYNEFALYKIEHGSVTLVRSLAGFHETSNSGQFEVDANYIWVLKNNKLHRLTLGSDLKGFVHTKIYDKLSSRLLGVKSIHSVDQKIYFQRQNHFFRYFDEFDDFFEDKVMGARFKGIPEVNTVEQDANGDIWYLYDDVLGLLKKGKGKYVKQESLFKNFKGNLVTNFLSVNAVNDHDIFIGLTDGLAHYSSGDFSKYLYQPKAFIDKFIAQKDTIYSSRVSFADESSAIELPYSSNQIKFAFSSPTYENQQNTMYSYKLEPFESEFTPWSVNSSKEYTNLREGSYVMKLRAKNSFGLISELKELHFEIYPPWYRHFLAYITYLLLLMVCIYLIYRRVQLKIRKDRYYETIEQRRLFLERENKIKLEQSELEKEIERLKSDKLKIKILAKDKELVSNSLRVVKKNKVLNGIITKLKDIDTKIVDDTAKFEFGKLHKTILKEVNTDKSWQDLEKHIKNVHFDFLKRLKEKCPNISPRELDLSTYLLMNMSTKEIAEIMNISSGGVELARYRLRKKLNLNKKENLTGYLMTV